MTAGGHVFDYSLKVVYSFVQQQFLTCMGKQEQMWLSFILQHVWADSLKDKCFIQQQLLLDRWLSFDEMHVVAEFAIFLSIAHMRCKGKTIHFMLYLYMLFVFVILLSLNAGGLFTGHK